MFTPDDGHSAGPLQETRYIFGNGAAFLLVGRRAPGRFHFQSKRRKQFLRRAPCSGLNRGVEAIS